MSPKQKELARHALGLPNNRGRSYRNRFLTGGPSPEWAAMVDDGFAEAGKPDAEGRQWFWLTPAGAQAALEPREKLCPEDFPVAQRSEARA